MFWLVGSLPKIDQRKVVASCQNRVIYRDSIGAANDYISEDPSFHVLTSSLNIKGFTNLKVSEFLVFLQDFRINISQTRESVP